MSFREETLADLRREDFANEVANEIARLNNLVADRDAEIARLREALRPFAEITPSTLYPNDGSGGDSYHAYLASRGPPHFTGEDLRRARVALLGENLRRARAVSREITKGE